MFFHFAFFLLSRSIGFSRYLFAGRTAFIFSSNLEDFDAFSISPSILFRVWKIIWNLARTVFVRSKRQNTVFSRKVRAITVLHSYTTNIYRVPRVAHLNTSINLDLRPNPTLTHYWHVTISDYGHRLPQCLSSVIYKKLWQINGDIKLENIFKRYFTTIPKILLPLQRKSFKIALLLHTYLSPVCTNKQDSLSFRLPTQNEFLKYLTFLIVQGKENVASRAFLNFKPDLPSRFKTLQNKRLTEILLEGSGANIEGQVEVLFTFLVETHAWIYICFYSAFKVHRAC